MRSLQMPRPGRGPIILVFTLGLAALGAAWRIGGAPLHAQEATLHEHAGHVMDDAAMERWVRDWYAAHPASPTAVAAAGAPADTFLAAGTTFNADQNAATVVDTAHIFTGQSILWQWINGTHTTTNGTGSTDPNAGLLWDAPITSAAPQFVRRFDAVGMFPFFCRPHEGFNMKGVVVVAAPADTFLASGTTFDTDGNLATQVDTAYVAPGQAVMWREVSLSHTVTSGTGSADPNVGKLFDVPLSGTAPVFTFVYNTVGTYPFFCRVHESVNMRGVVIVTTLLAVEPVAGPAGEGFVSEPWPSPTRGAVSFRFALREAGPVRAEVFDASGRRVAVVAGGSYPAGPYVASWNGRALDGERVAAGVYYLRLNLPGFAGTRRVVVVP